jgi:hypothetical protein
MAKAAKAKKTAASDAGKPAAKKAAKKAPGKKAPGKKAAAKTAAAKTAAAKTASGPTEADWAQIYAKAWVDDAFRTLLETNPTAALQQYAKENRLAWTKLVQLPEQPPASDADENCIHLVSCC